MQEYACEIASENRAILQDILQILVYARNMAAFMHFLAKILQGFYLQYARLILQVYVRRLYSCKNIATCKTIFTLARYLIVFNHNKIIMKFKSVSNTYSVGLRNSLCIFVSFFFVLFYQQ